MNIEERVKYLNSIGYAVDELQLHQNANKTVIVGMSGGVDSSSCAAVIKLLGYKTIGMFMKNWEEIDADGVCTAETDYQDVISVCEKLDIPYYSVNFSEEYRENVFKYFVEEYKAGFTPNPDILCNREIKFKVFFDKAKDFGADYLATGHYCQKIGTGKDTKLLKGLDKNKDQTYFLYTMQSEILDDVLFPIGHIEKKYVREIAEEFGLTTFDKKDSTGICFIGERNFKKFLANYIKGQKGKFVKLDDKTILGDHDGMCFYTIGQRKGLGLGGPGGPWFVVDKDIENNIVYVAEGENHTALYADELFAIEESWVGERPVFPIKCQAKIRYRQQDQDCTVTEVDGKLKVSFFNPQRAISKRQSIVFYQEEQCLGGAIIDDRGETYFERNISLN
jgi:tRNA-specific 2-thiouridylase